LHVKMQGFFLYETCVQHQKTLQNLFTGFRKYFLLNKII
jgi:hypothetical protein